MATTDVSDSALANQHQTLEDFESRFRHKPQPGPSVISTTGNVIKKYAKNFNIKNTLLSTFPIIETLASYNVRENLISDVIAGIMAGVTMIPQSMAFATLSTLPHYIGLYMSFFAPLTYFLFGTSRHLAWGCVAIVSIMMADIMDKYDKSDDAKSFISHWNYQHQQEHFLPRENISSFIGNKVDTGSFDSAYEYLFNSLYVRNSTDNTELLEAIDDRRIEVASGVTVITGFIFIAASIIGFHRISTVMSNSLITGFTVGVSFHIATSQVKGILDLPIKRYAGTGRIFRTWIAIFENISETKVTALIISLVCIVIIYLVKKFINERYKHRLRVPFPIELFVVIGGTLLSYYMHFITNHKVRVVGKVPSGMPKPKFPDLSLSTDYIGDAIVIIIVSYAQSLAMAKTMALEHNYGIDPQQEMLASGICSTICGVFHGYIPGGSVSISLIQASAGGKSRVASLFSAAIVLLVILVLGPYVKYLPHCVMAAIILVNLRSMFMRLIHLPYMWRTSRYDCAVWVFACIVTIILDTGLALIASIAFSIFLVLFRSMIKTSYEIGQINADTSSVELRSVENYECIQKFNSIKLLKVKTSVLFFNADIFTASIFTQTGLDPIRIKAFQNSARGRKRKEKKKYDKLDECELEVSVDMDNNEALPVLAIKTIILDCSEVSFVDAMGVQAFETVIREFSSIKIDVLIASVSENLFDILQSTGFWKRHEHRLYLNVPAALASLPAPLDKYHLYGETVPDVSKDSLY